MAFDLALTGDSIVNRAVPATAAEGFRDLVGVLREADVSYTHFEGLCHDYDGPECYPAARSGGTWVRAPPDVADALSTFGVDLVSHASNHALDFSYGGLRQTWDALDEAGLAHAGTGENLAAAREPATVDAPDARVAMVSMTTSFTDWSRAGEARRDMGGRPGVNALRHHYAADEETLEAVRDLGEALGYVVVETDEAVVLTDPASRNAVTRFERADEGTGACRRVLHERDREANLRAVADAADTADVVVAHVHGHEFRPGEGIGRAPPFVEAFAREAVEAGADVVVCQGSHAPTRGIEVYDGSPILYDPGEFFLQSNTATRQPSDFYERHADGLETHPAEATPVEGLRARGFDLPWEGAGFSDEDAMRSPEGGFFTGPGGVLVRCRFDDELVPESLTLHPLTWRSEPRSLTGVPVAADGERAAAIVEHVASQSQVYGTDVECRDGRGHLSV